MWRIHFQHLYTVPLICFAALDPLFNFKRHKVITRYGQGFFKVKLSTKTGLKRRTIREIFSFFLNEVNFLASRQRQHDNVVESQGQKKLEKYLGIVVYME